MNRYSTVCAVLALGFGLGIALPGSLRAADGDVRRRRDCEARSAMCDRALEYLFSMQKDGCVGETRPKAVTSAFLLACLSDGIRPDDPEHGGRLRDAAIWLLRNSSPSFLGGTEEPNGDHALAALALMELVGTCSSEEENRELFRRAQAVTQYTLRIQDASENPAYFGGWRPNDVTRTNDRMLTAWFLAGLRGAELDGIRIPSSASRRAVEFIEASQKGTDTAKKEDIGGFSVAASGLPVRSTTAAGLAVLMWEGDDTQKSALACEWLARNPPVWYGPHFYESNFFAARALGRQTTPEGKAAFKAYYERLVRLMAERQEADGSFPFPPGHGGPLVAMGPGYSTAMAVLILNADRGFLPVDQ